LKDDPRPASRFTTLIDLYGLPPDFPGWARGFYSEGDPYSYINLLEREFANDIDDERFIPYIQLHEYETLLFSSPQTFDCLSATPSQVGKIAKIAQDFGNIELINRSRQTAPSKRIEGVFPGYDKVANGVDIAELIGLPTLREKCPHFNEWITKLEQLQEDL